MFRTGAFFRPTDALILISVAAAAAWGFLSFRLADGGRAVVYVGDAKYGWYDLAGPKRAVAVPTSIGTVNLEIGEGSVRVTSSPCRNQICVKTGAVRRAHSEVVCMPAHLLVVLEGRSGETGPREKIDAVTY